MIIMARLHEKMRLKLVAFLFYLYNMKRNLRIVFMGTPDFAVPSLDILVQHNYNVVGVITAPDKPSGRGQQLNQSAVKKYAVEKT